MTYERTEGEMDEVLNQGRFDAWRNAIVGDGTDLRPPLLDVFRDVILCLIDEAEQEANGRGARWRAHIEGEVDRLLGADAGAKDDTVSPGEWMAPLMTMFGQRSEEVRCDDTEPHDQHGVDFGDHGFWCPGVPLVEDADAEPQEGYTRFTVSTPMPPGNDVQFTGIVSLTREDGTTFLSREYVAKLVEAAQRAHSAEADVLRRQVDGQNAKLHAQAEVIDQLKSQVVSDSVDSEMFPPGYQAMFLPGHAERTATFWKRRFVSQSEEIERLRSQIAEGPLSVREDELEHLREFKRVAHQALDEAGVPLYPDVECRIVARIEALTRTMVQADRLANEHMRRSNDYRKTIDVLTIGFGPLRDYVARESRFLTASSQGGRFLLGLARLLDDRLPGYTYLYSVERDAQTGKHIRRYPEADVEAEET